MPGASIAVLTFAWIALTGLLVGSAILRRCGRGFSPALRLMVALGVGLPVLAYATLALGLLGQLGRTQLMALLVSGAIGLGLGWRAGPDVWATLRRVGRALCYSRQRLLYGALVLWAAMLVPVTLLPPGREDWDGVAEHLAMAKVWLLSGSIHPLWYDHHCQFPATLQMLYVLGLAFGGPVAAKLIHFLFGMLSVGAVGLLARRHFGAKTTGIAMLIMATTPAVGWLATIAYVDLGPLFYTVLGLSFFLDWLRGSRAAALWAGVWLGLAMAMKMQSLLFFGILAAGALWMWWRGRARQRLPLGQIAAFAGVALAIAAPWYIKSWIWTGNPVYPFAYSVFDGKEWSTWQAEQYTYAQKAWGLGDLPPSEEYWKLPPLQRAFLGPHRPDHLLLAPLGLTFYPWYYVDKGWGEVSAILQISAGPLYLAFLPLLFLYRRRPRAWAVMGWALIPVIVWWLWSAQYTRYFLPGLGWLAAPAAWAALQAARRGRAQRWAVGLALGVILGLNLYVSFLRIQEVAPVLAGGVSVERYLSATLQPYSPCEWLNLVMQPSDKVITYGEPRLFYLDRPYLWGDPAYHHLLVYDKMKSADDLVAGYRSLGIDYVLINLAFTSGSPGMEAQSPLARLLRAAIAEGQLKRMPVSWPGRSYVVFRLEPAETAGGG